MGDRDAAGELVWAARLSVAAPPVGMAIGAHDVARARQVAWTAATVAMLALGLIGVTVTVAPELWSGLFTSDAGVRESANLYLRWAGIGFPFLGLALALYFASQGSGTVVGPVLAGGARLAVVALGGWWLTAIDAPAWSLFALVRCIHDGWRREHGCGRVLREVARSPASIEKA